MVEDFADIRWNSVIQADEGRCKGREEMYGNLKRILLPCKTMQENRVVAN